MDSNSKVADDLAIVEVAEKILRNAQSEETSILNELGELQKEVDEIMRNYLKK